MADISVPVSASAVPASKRDLFEAPVAKVMKQEVRNLVVRDEKIRKAVAIVIRNADGHALAFMPGDSGLLGNILKSSAAQVSIKLVVCALEQTGGGSRREYCGRGRRRTHRIPASTRRS